MSVRMAAMLLPEMVKARGQGSVPRSQKKRISRKGAKDAKEEKEKQK
jgi:hypothetical protein